jgi:ribosomal protein S27E
MATAKRARAKAEPKELKLVCKCDDCRHWEIVLVRETKAAASTEYARSSEYIECMSCGTKIGCYFSVGAHEGLHYEAHKRNER